MMGYIDKDKAYDVLTEYYHHTTEEQHAALREALNKVPAENVVPVMRGRWRVYEIADEEALISWRCPFCGGLVGTKYSFCPICGADLRETQCVEWGVFAKRVKELMLKAGVSQRELAKQIGVTEVSMSRYLASERVPKATLIIKLANALGTSCDYLLGTSNIERE